MVFALWGRPALPPSAPVSCRQPRTALHHWLSTHVACAGRTGLLWLNGLVLALGSVRAAPQVEDSAQTDAACSETPADARESCSTTENVVVRGQRPLLLSSPDVPTAASTVLVGSSLTRAGDNAADVLMHVPSVQLQRSGSGAEWATATIRGTDARQTPVYIAGVRINDDVSGAADLSTVPLWMMQRVEIYRGNSPMSVERLGLSGAIAFHPRHPTETRVGGELEIGSFGRRAGWVAGEVGGKGASALVAVGYERARNDYPFINDHGLRFDRRETRERRRNADSEAYDLWAIGNYDLGRHGRLVTVLGGFDREQGVTGLSTTPAVRARSRRRRLLAGASASWSCSGQPGCRIDLQSSALSASERVRDPLRELRTLRSEESHQSARRYSHAVAVTLGQLMPVQVRARLWLSADQLELHRQRRYGSQATRQVFGASVDALYAVGDWLVHAALAAQCHDTDGRYEARNAEYRGEASECTVPLPDGRVGFTYRFTNDWSLLGNVGRYTRYPTLGELYGTSPFIEGNPELGRERSSSADAGVRGRWVGRGVEVALDGFAFVRWSDQLVRYRQTSMHAFSPYNVGSARSVGMELSASTRWFEHFETQTALTLLDPRETTDDRFDATVNDVLPMTSRLVAGQTLTAFTAWPRLAIERLSLSLRYLHRASRYADAAGLVTLPAQHFFDLELGVQWGSPDVRVSASLDNAFDAPNLDLIGLPLPPRSYALSVEAWW